MNNNGNTAGVGRAEYIWLDGAQPTNRLRSKTRVVVTSKGDVTLRDFPEWSFDGSSTYQAEGGDSDMLLRPVNYVTDPIRGEGNFLVMCEVLNPDGTPHATNTRAKLRETLDSGAASLDPWFGFEQEYALTRNGRVLGFEIDGQQPAPQGPYFCSVGADVAFGRPLAEAHTKACIDAGLLIYGINAEVLPGQWEFQIGYRGVSGESADPLNVSDHLWFARWLLYRLGEDFNLVPTFDSKPVKGDWNGSGNHTNFSTKETRDRLTGRFAIEAAIEALSAAHSEHIAVYGEGLKERLTGLHETASIDVFRGGVADRGASIRIPQLVALRGYGYLEDRRPAANADPYLVAERILRTILDGSSVAPSRGAYFAERNGSSSDAQRV